MPTHSVPLPHHTCPLCGGPNACAPASVGTFDVDCWCRRQNIDPSALARLPAEQIGQACLCPSCASGDHLRDSDSAS